MKLKKIIALLLVFSLIPVAIGCNKEKDATNPVELINFEEGTLNIDTTKIEEYVKGKGYENIRFSFDVDKQIYSCEVALSEEESKKIKIDGEGYESFISQARGFLVQGTGVMKEVISGYGLSGISSGMVLLSSDDVVYCVAVDGTITYVSHIANESASIENVKEIIKEKAEALLNTKVSVNFNALEHFISINYEGKQTQDAVETTFEKIRAYLNEAGFNNYLLGIGGNDGQPFVREEKEPIEKPIVNVPENVSYNHVGNFGMSSIPLFEVVSTEEEHQNAADLAITTLERELDSKFYFYVVDENEKFLGNGSEDGYTPYVYSDFDKPYTQPSYVTPFTYYFSKYFNNIEYVDYQYNSYYKTAHGKIQYEFSINFKTDFQYEEVKEAMSKVLNGMYATLGDKSANVVLIAYPQSIHEVEMVSDDLIPETVETVENQEK